MSNLIFDLRQETKESTFYLRTRKWLRKQVLEEKLLNPFGVVLFLTSGILIAIISALAGIKGAMGVLALSIGLPLLVSIFFNMKAGVIFLLTFESFAGIVYRLITGVTWGVVVDFFVGLIFFGLFIKQIGKRDWSFAKNPITTWLLVWIVFNILEVGNPSAASRVAWVYTVRSIALTYVFYFAALYAITSLDYITKLFKILLCLALISALYGLFQEFVFYPQYDLDSFIHNPVSRDLMFQGGKYRKFSTYGDPVVFGVMMAMMCLFCVVLSIGPFELWKKILLRITAFLCVFSMLFSGTRTAYVLIPVGFVFFVLLLHRKDLLKVLVGLGIFGVILIFMPAPNATIYRFQTAFNPGKDASFNVREVNQRLIKPFIQTHPIGGGLGSTGEFGKRFSPGTLLARFPPDSSYARFAVENGWIGLFIFFGLLFTILKEGIRGYFRCKNPRIKIYYAALVTILYILCIGAFPQDVIAQYPIAALFCIIAAMIARMKEFDPAYSEGAFKA